MIQRSYADDQLAVIPMDLLNDNCEIVDDDNFPENWEQNALEDSYHTFLTVSQDIISGDLSSMDISGPILDVESQRYLYLKWNAK